MHLDSSLQPLFWKQALSEIRPSISCSKLVNQFIVPAGQQEFMTLPSGILWGTEKRKEPKIPYEETSYSNIKIVC